MMKITVNNKIQSISEASNIDDLLVELNIEPNGIAFAINHTVVSKSDWHITELRENDNIIIIKATQGG